MPTRPEVEERRLAGGEVEIRELEDGRFTFTGYAAVFNRPSEPLPFTETVLPGAFARTLKAKPDVPLIINHDRSRLLAATSAGTLRLAEDERGLLAQAELVPTSEARDLKLLADTGHVRHMSFAFKPTPKGEAWSEDGRQRSLSEVRLHEVSVLTAAYAPAYRETTAYLRSLAHRLDIEPDALAIAVSGLAEGRALDDDELELVEAALADLRPKRGVPPSVRRRLVELAAKRPD